jgi:hypothetical protein
VSVASRREAEEGGGADDVALWVGCFAGPFAFAVDEAASYALAPTACAAGAKLPLHLVALGAFVVALAGLGAARRAWRRLREPAGPVDAPVDPAMDPAPGRRRFMALSGLILSAGFALAIVALEIPNLVLPLRACR